MQTNPEIFSAYACSDYLQSEWSGNGHFDDATQTLVIVPLNDVYEVADSGFLAVGRSGCGGIDFGYRKNQDGLWAFYPIEQEFKFLAGTVQELVDGWCSGRLWV